jgi:hypothetical protein
MLGEMVLLNDAEGMCHLNTRIQASVPSRPPLHLSALQLKMDCPF